MTGTDHGPDLEGLDDFTGTTDRELTEFFVGRGNVSGELS